MSDYRDYFVYVQDPARCGVSLRSIARGRNGKFFRNGKVPKALRDKRSIVVSGTSKLDAELTAHDYLCKKAPHWPRW